MKNLVILGMHRSGTSLITRALANAGLAVGDPGDLLVDQEDNPHGFYERRDVVALNDALLEHQSATWFAPPDEIIPADFAGAETSKIFASLPEQGWLLKDPRMTLTWPHWQESCSGAGLLFVYRNPWSVARSLHKRHGFPMSFGLALWQRYNAAALTICAANPDASCAISFDRILSDPSSNFALLQERLAERGLPLDLQGSAGLLDAELGHPASRTGSADAGFLSDSQQSLSQLCESICDGGSAFSAVDMPASVGWFLRDSASALEPLSDAIETRQQLVESRTLCDERTRERDQGLSQLSTLETSYAALDKAHDAEKSRHKALEHTYNELAAEHDDLAHAHTAEVAQHGKLRESYIFLQATHDRLAEEHRVLTQKAEYLFEVLIRTFNNLLSFELSFTGRISRYFRRGYRLLTFQRGKGTAYEDALADAHHHFTEFDLPVPHNDPGKVALAGNVIKYVLRNPAGSVRSFSGQRLKRATQVFLGSDATDLKVWIDARFPELESTGVDFSAAELDATLDDLELEFLPCDTPRVSIVIPVYNEYRMTMTCLQALSECLDDQAVEIIIADDCSDDLTTSLADRVHNIRVNRMPENGGFIENCRSAAAVAQGEFIVFLNNDTAVTPGWLDSMLAVMTSRPDAGIVGPKLLFADGKLQEAGGIAWRDGSAWNYGRADDPGKPQYNYLKTVDYISGACLLIRRSLWEDIGGFDTRYKPAYYEDADLAFAVREKGFEVYYQPASVVYHFEGVSNGTDLSAGIKQHQLVNQEKFREKWAAVLDAEHFDNADHVFLARDRSRNQRVVVYVDHYVPHHDKDAGSRSTLYYVQLMLAMGYRVLFIGANFFPHKPYTSQLQQMGVEVLVGEYMARNLENWLKENAPYIDNIYLHRPHVAEQFLDHFHKMKPRPNIVFFGHDLHYLRAQREHELAGLEGQSAAAVEWRAREFAVFDRVDKVYYPSQVEIDEISRTHDQLETRAIPLYALESSAVPGYDAETRQGLLFVGGFNHPPNVDGIQWFVSDVLPRIAEQIPDIHLHVVGSNPPDAVTELQSENVTVYGYLEDDELADLYAKVRVAVVPLRFGAGVKGKVIEAIQRGVPLVTTAVGAEGIPESDSVMTVADDDSAFAEGVTRAYREPEHSQDMLSGYAAWLDRHFSRDRAARIVEEDFGQPLRPFKSA